MTEIENCPFATSCDKNTCVKYELYIYTSEKKPYFRGHNNRLKHLFSTSIKNSFYLQ
jgi:hypothetical protein